MLAASGIAAGAVCTAGGSGALWLLAAMGSRGTIKRATILMILISGFTAGPAVSL